MKIQKGIIIFILAVLILLMTYINFSQYEKFGNNLNKLNFIHIPKTGGTSMGAQMLDNSGGHDTLKRYKLRSTRAEPFDYDAY